MSNSTTKAQAEGLSVSWQICLAVMVSAAVVMLPDFANATPTPPAAVNPFETAFCTIVGWFTGATGRALATIGVTIIGIGALLGKVSWGMALIVGIGVAITFGAAGIVDQLGGNSANSC